MKKQKVLDPGLMLGYLSVQVTSHIIPALIQFGFFDQISKMQPDSIKGLAKKLQVDQRVLTALMYFLVDQQLIHRHAEKYSLSNLAKKFLTNDAGCNLSAFSMILANHPAHQTIINSIIETLKTGKPTEFIQGQQWIDTMKNMDNTEAAHSFLNALATRARMISSVLADRPCKIFSNNPKVLDIGGGHGDLLYALVTKHRLSNCAILETPAVAQSIETHLEMAHPEYSSHKEISIIPGNMFIPLPEGYSVHVYANVIRDWDAEEIATLLKNSRGSLTKDGKIIIIETLIKNNLKNSRPTINHGAYLALHTHGRCYTTEEIRNIINNLRGPRMSIEKIVPLTMDYSAIVIKK